MITILVWSLNVLVNLKEVDVIYCDIKGNVKNPGVYEVKEGEVINDVILKAGGLKKNSYVKNINLSKKVTDEMVINILSIDEYEKLTYVCPICECEDVITYYCDEEITTTIKSTTKAKIKSTTSSTTTSTFAEPTTNIITSSFMTTEKITTIKDSNLININIASVTELMKLPGIGEKTALKVIDYRSNKIFETIEEIKEVSGIGEGLFAKIKDYITV